MRDSYRRHGRRSDPVVLSMRVLATVNQPRRNRGPFEILVRHLLDRLLSSEALGSSEEAGVRIAQIAYAAALPAMLFALYLFPAYHLPQEKPSFWFQCGDHCFYVAYAFVTMGLFTVLQWDLLFPDRLDALVLAGMPIPVHVLLTARACALSLFFGALLLGTSALGIVFFPGVVDLRGIGLHLAWVQLVAVLASGFCGLTLFVALRSLLLCMSSRRWVQGLSTVLQVLCMITLFAALLFIPFCVHFLQQMLQFSGSRAFWFPPFWFLGLYQWLLNGPHALPLFRELGSVALCMLAFTFLLCLLLYPFAHQRRTAQILEGSVPQVGKTLRQPIERALQNIVRAPRAFAVIRFIGQTLWRTQRTRVLLAAFGGIGLAASAIALFIPSLLSTAPSLHGTAAGVRLALPFVSLWVVISLRTTLHASVAMQGYWAFQVIEGLPKAVHLQAAKHWTAACSTLLSIAALGLLDGWILHCTLHAEEVVAQFVMAIVIPVIATDLFFFHESSLPFTSPRPYSVNDLSWFVVIYLVLLPATVLLAAKLELWMSGGLLRIGTVCLVFGVVHQALHVRRSRNIAKNIDVDMPGSSLAAGELGLRDR